MEKRRLRIPELKDGASTFVKNKAKRITQRCQKLRADWSRASGAALGIFRRDNVGLFFARVGGIRGFGAETGDGIFGWEGSK